MGAINYGTSDYITMGIKTVDGWDLLHDPGIKPELEAEAAESGRDVEEVAEAWADDYNEADHENASEVFNKYDFKYFDISMHYGYYDGFYFDIQPASCINFATYEDKREAQKEITRIKQMFKELAGVGVVACSPGWCTGYSDYAGTIQKINEAIKEMRADVKAEPTDWQYARRNGWL